MLQDWEALVHILTSVNYIHWTTLSRFCRRQLSLSLSLLVRSGRPYVAVVSSVGAIWW